MNNKDKLSKLKVIDRDMIKYIVLIFMGLGHFLAWMCDPETKAIYHLPVPYQILTNMSLIAPPTFFFFISEGFRYTKSRKKYAERLFIFACITQIPYFMLYPPTGISDLVPGFNVFYSLFCSLLALMVYESDRTKKKKILLITLICILSILTEWLCLSVFYTLIWYAYRDNLKKRALIFTIVTVLYNSISIIAAIVSEQTWSSKYELLGGIVRFAAMMLSLVLITFFYNGKKGKYPVFSKWFFYIFYPAHILVVVLLRRFRI